MMTEIGTTTIDRERLLDFRAQEFKEADPNASSIFNSSNKIRNVTSELLIDAYQKADDARFRVFNEFYAIVQDLKRLGLLSNQK